MNEDDEHEHEVSSSSHLLVALEDLLKRSHNSSIFIPKVKYQSKSLDDLTIYKRNQQEEKNQQISNTTRTKLDLSNIEYDEQDNDYDLHIQRSRSAPVSPTKIYDKELAAFIQCDQQQQELIGDNFIYNIDLSYSNNNNNNNSHQQNSKLAIFFEDDFSSEEIIYEPSVNLIHTSHINSCLTITEENEEELEQLKRDDDDDDDDDYQDQQENYNYLSDINENSTSIDILSDHINISENDNQINKNELNNINNQLLINMNKCEDNIERLSTIYESPSPQPEIEEEFDDDIYDKLIVYDIADVNTTTKLSMDPSIEEPTVSTSISYCSPIINQNHLNSCYTNACFEPCPNLTNVLSVSRLCGTTNMIISKDNNPLSLPPSTSTSTTNIDEKTSSSPVINTQIIPSSFSPKQQHQQISSIPPLNKQLNSLNDNNKFISSQQHIKKMKVIQSSSSSLSDFISPTSQNTSYYEEVPNVHYSLTDCSLKHQNSLINNKNKILDNNQQQKFSSNRRILTNGLLLSHCSTNPIPRRKRENLYSRNNTKKNDSIKQKSEEKLSSDSSSSSELLSSSNEKILSRSDFILQHEHNIPPERKSSSLKSIYMTSPQLTSKILYPIDFENNNIDISWYRKQLFYSHKVPTSDSGIIIDTQPTSKSSIEEDDNNDTSNIDQLKQYKINYQKTLNDLTVIKKNIVDTDSRLNEATRELEIEQALIEGEHELVFKQILDASEIDQKKIRQLYKNLQLLIEKIMTEKNFIRNEIDYIQQILFKFEHELYELEQQYPSLDEKILQKKEIINITRKKYEDLEFQLMELETRYESELEQAEEHFQNEQKIVTQNAKLRQDTLRELDHQQYMVLYQVTMEKEKLEREKQKFKLIFKHKKLEANELIQKIHNKKKSNEITEMLAKVKLEKMINLEEQIKRYNENKKRIELEQKLSDEIQNSDYHVQLREKNRAQERPLTRYLPIHSSTFDLCAHIESAGHLLDSSYILLTKTSCRGYLHKMGGIKFKTWNRRWFVFDRQSHSLFYYQDKSETKLRGCISFQSILEVYIDHLQSISLRSPEPRQATFIVKTIQRPYYLVAPTIESMRIWIDVIITGAEGNIFAAV